MLAQHLVAVLPGLVAAIAGGFWMYRHGHEPVSQRGFGRSVMAILFFTAVLAGVATAVEVAPPLSEVDWPSRAGFAAAVSCGVAFLGTAIGGVANSGRDDV